MGVIVAGIITPCGAVVKCQDANMGSEAGEGKAEPPLLWSSGLLLFDAAGPGWVRCNRACEVLVPKSARDACTVVVAFVAIGLLGARLPFALIVGYSLHGLWDLLHEFQRMEPTPRSSRPADRDPARLRSVLCSHRLVLGGVFLWATFRVDCCVEEVPQ